MHFEVVTLFPELFASPLATTLLGRAVARSLISVDYTNPRDFTTDKHHSVDDTPYGGGPGMVMRPEPLVAAIESALAARGPARRILLCPSGAPLTQAIVDRLAKEPRLLLVCGRYEGFDERVREHVDEELSLGDFVLSGGEPAAFALIDAVARRVPGVLGNADSTAEESHATGLLEYPQYTRPAEFRGRAVPEALISGHHERVRVWRRQQALSRTRARRPELLRSASLDDADRAFLASEAGAAPSLPGAQRTWVALLHHPVYDRNQRVVATALTNLDLHDIARSSRTYNLAGYFIVHPVAAQRELAARIISHWVPAEGDASAPRNDFRRMAVERIHVVDVVDAAIAEITRVAGASPRLLATSARATSVPAVSWQDARAHGGPQLVIFGTGWGLTDELLARCHGCLPPVSAAPECASDYNHLSVRSACAIVLDRLYGDRG